VVAALAGVRPGTTCCPGTLARRLGTTPAALRPVLARLAAAGRVRITQGGLPRDLATLHGPYRVTAICPDGVSLLRVARAPSEPLVRRPRVSQPATG